MADKTVNDLNDPARREVTLAVTYQVETMLQAILAASMKDDDQISYLIDAMVPRLLDLNSVVMSAAGDDAEEVTSLRYRLFGGWHPERTASA